MVRSQRARAQVSYNEDENDVLRKTGIIRQKKRPHEGSQAPGKNRDSQVKGLKENRKVLKDRNAATTPPSNKQSSAKTPSGGDSGDKENQHPFSNKNSKDRVVSEPKKQTQKRTGEGTTDQHPIEKPGKGAGSVGKIDKPHAKVRESSKRKSVSEKEKETNKNAPLEVGHTRDDSATTNSKKRPAPEASRTERRSKKSRASIESDSDATPDRTAAASKRSSKEKEDDATPVTFPEDASNPIGHVQEAIRSLEKEMETSRDTSEARLDAARRLIQHYQAEVERVTEAHRASKAAARMDELKRLRTQNLQQQEEILRLRDEVLRLKQAGHGSAPDGVSTEPISADQLASGNGSEVVASDTRSPVSMPARKEDIFEESAGTGSGSDTMDLDTNETASSQGTAPSDVAKDGSESVCAPTEGCLAEKESDATGTSEVASNHATPNAKPSTNADPDQVAAASVEAQDLAAPSALEDAVEFLHSLGVVPVGDGKFECIAKSRISDREVNYTLDRVVEDGATWFDYTPLPISAEQPDTSLSFLPEFLREVEGISLPEDQLLAFFATLNRAITM
eukprot:Rmarinus@m.515